jgi:nicotinamidase-related amidase
MLTASKLLIKHYPNSFRNTLLLEKLKERETEQLIVCGAMTHMCIDSTVRAAFDLGFPVIVVADGCSTRELNYSKYTFAAPNVHAAFLAALNGLFADLKHANIIHSILT